MGEALNMYPNLNVQQQCRLDKINEVKDCFIAEIRERELISKRLSKYIASFDYFDSSIYFGGFDTFYAWEQSKPEIYHPRYPFYCCIFTQRYRNKPT